MLVLRCQTGVLFWPERNVRITSSFARFREDFHIFSVAWWCFSWNLSILLFIPYKIIYKWSGFNYVSGSNAPGKFMSSCAPKCAFVLHAILIVSGAHNFTIPIYAMLGMKEYRKKTRTHTHCASVAAGWVCCLFAWTFGKGRQENKTRYGTYFFRWDRTRTYATHDVPRNDISTSDVWSVFSFFILCFFSLIRIYFFRFSIQFWRKILCGLFVQQL